MERVDLGAGGRNSRLGFEREGKGVGGKEKECGWKEAHECGGCGSEVVWEDGRRRLGKVWTSLQWFLVYTESC